MQVEHLRHPPGEALRLPHPPQAGRRIALDLVAAAAPERIFEIVDARRRRPDARPADAVKAVAAADEIAAELIEPAAVAETDFRARALEVVHADVVDLEQNLSAVGKAACNQILH